MTAVEMLDSLRRRGIILVPSARGELKYRPRDALSDIERIDVARHRRAIVSLLDADPVGWRTSVMASQVSATGSVPLLMARPGSAVPPGACCSCGDPLDPQERYRCGPCAAAAVAALQVTG